MKYLNKVNAICRYGLPVIAAILFAACGDKSSDEPAPDPDPTPDPVTELSFLCNVSDVTATSASISVSPIDGYTGYYYFDVMAKSEYEAQYAGNHEALIAQFEARVQEYADSYIEAGQVSSIEELMESAIASKGIAGYLYETLNPLTDYCVWACGVNLQGKVTSDVSIIGEFTTLDVEHSGMTFAIAYDPDTYQLTLTPSGDEPYVWGLLSAEDYQTYYNNSAEECIRDLVDTYVEGGVLEENLCAGPLSTSMILKATVGENVVLAAGYKDGITTGVAEYRFDFEGNPSATITGDVDTTLGGMTSAFYSNWGETPAGSGLDQATVMLSDYESMRQLYIDVWFPHGEAISGTYAINNTNEARTDHLDAQSVVLRRAERADDGVRAVCAAGVGDDHHLGRRHDDVLYRDGRCQVGRLFGQGQLLGHDVRGLVGECSAAGGDTRRAEGPQALAAASGFGLRRRGEG